MSRARRARYAPAHGSSRAPSARRIYPPRPECLPCSLLCAGRCLEPHPAQHHLRHDVESGPWRSTRRGAGAGSPARCEVRTAPAIAWPRSLMWARAISRCAGSLCQCVCVCRSSDGRALHCIHVCYHHGLPPQCRSPHLLRCTDMSRGAGTCGACRAASRGVCRRRVRRDVAHAWHPIEVGFGGSYDPPNAFSSASAQG